MLLYSKYYLQAVDYNIVSALTDLTTWHVFVLYDSDATLKLNYYYKFHETTIDNIPNHIFSNLQRSAPCPCIVLQYRALAVFTPQLAGEAYQLGCPKIVLDHVHVIKKLCAPQCLSACCIGNT